MFKKYSALCPKTSIAKFVKTVALIRRIRLVHVCHFVRKKNLGLIADGPAVGQLMSRDIGLS